MFQLRHNINFSQRLAQTHIILGQMDMIYDISKHISDDVAILT